MQKDITKIRNIAIIAHVDHGKTTLVDRFLDIGGELSTDDDVRILDSNDLEKERGITITAKNASIEWKGHKINLIDTPGHADFGGEVERILSMVDSVLLLVDAAEGPMPQTRFVTQKAFEQSLKPIVVVNKVDKDDARPGWVVDKVFDLFCDLNANDEQLEFPVVYSSAMHGQAWLDLSGKENDVGIILDKIIDIVPHPQGNISKPFKMQVSSLDHSNYLGTIGVGKVYQGTVRKNDLVKVISADESSKDGKISQVLEQKGLKQLPVDVATTGDIVAISGIEGIRISDTICNESDTAPLPHLNVDEPTVGMMFIVNDSPFAGREGKHVTSRKIRDRLNKELLHNVSLKVEDTDSPEKFRVSGRGELHLGILIENMRREGYELSISRPEVINKTIDDVIHEPYEKLVISIPIDCQGSVIDALNSRQARLENIYPDNDRIRLEYSVPTKGLIGFHSEFMNITSGTGLMHYSFSHYEPASVRKVFSRKQGVLISNSNGKATAFAIWNLQSRGKIIIEPQQEVYEGMIVGIHSRENDLVVNIVKEKQLTNVRASGKDDKIMLVPPVIFNLEQALEFIEVDELVEATPETIRIRKKLIKESERKRAKNS